MAVKLNDLIKVYDNVLPINVCQSLIDFYEKNLDKIETINEDKRPSFSQINLTEFHNQDEETTKIHNYVISRVLDHKKIYYEYVDSRAFPKENSFEQFRIKKYRNNGEDLFDSHVDVKSYSSARRYLSFLFYLNDVDEGGETIFTDMKIKPKAGRLLIFPPLWMYPHKGCQPISNEKYIMSTYLHYK
jgi:prolyl 4-hydroxylase